MLLLNSTILDTDVLKRLCMTASDQVDMKSQNFVYQIRRSQRNFGGCVYEKYKMYIQGCGEDSFVGKWKKKENLLSEAMRQKTTYDNSMVMTFDNEDGYRGGSLKLDGGVGIQWVPNTFFYDNAWQHVVDFWNTMVHELKHIADHQHGLEFSHHNSMRRPAHHKRPEEIRAKAAAQMSQEAVIDGRLPEVEKLLAHLTLQFCTRLTGNQ